ncbi:hypothetical protein B0H63DRAFT_477552 [Podospora didyma]|uniref:Uncharacterized protein n=1 Tax=Podospora didyma TaxID=330526 RepID=A0AAE0KJF0_9PEZI|nr:hypothetical protein B0H63DRAFT_477552 [Podospora didyma]
MKLHVEVLQMLKSGLSSPFTHFDFFLEELARSSRLVTIPRTSIARYSRLQFLSQRTVWLHGRADTLRCHKTPRHGICVTSDLFKRLVTTLCTECETEDQNQQETGKRTRGTGFLQTDILPYGEHSTDEPDILAASKSDFAAASRCGHRRGNKVAHPLTEPAADP